ncbi:hypothetical protein [Nesterenkonia pannonica]|uniref:hypothetical protein n=1 Tax=Nesterenkonia pannonica TaxID=1548602 RepID=UPI002164E112|nr:hypothetical protein [Nesterenkonia pannonica]
MHVVEAAALTGDVGDGHRLSGLGIGGPLGGLRLRSGVIAAVGHQVSAGAGERCCGDDGDSRLQSGAAGRALRRGAALCAHEGPLPDGLLLSP